MKTEINLNSWNRKEHYEFFSKMDQPSFGIVAEVDCTAIYQLSKDKNQSFFAHYLHRSMVAVNQVDAFKLRIVDDKVYQYDIIHAGSTIAREDGTFGFAFIEFSEDFDTFNNNLQNEILAVQNSTGLRLSNEDLDVNLIRHSTFPWHHFSAILHPSNVNNKECIPRIVFGKFTEKNGRKMLPVSIEAHHALMDGHHIALYLDAFQKELNR
ncbi:CatA-like O-acetyltransferase [Chryseobacterium sp. T1]